MLLLAMTFFLLLFLIPDSIPFNQGHAAFRAGAGFIKGKIGVHGAGVFAFFLYGWGAVGFAGAFNRTVAGAKGKAG